MRGIEVEVLDQSDALPPSVLKEQAKKNKPSVQSIISSIPPPSPTYAPIIVPFRASRPDERLTIISQTSFSLFSLFFDSDLCEIVAKNTNLKANNEYSRESKEQRRWHDTFASGIGAFLGILLYIGLALMPRITDYWNISSKFALHELVIRYRP